jgi:hypothetical protein
MKLFEINEELENLIDFSTGEITDIEAFENLKMERQDKLQNIALLYKNCKSDFKQLDELVKEYTARRNSCKNTMEWAKATLETELKGEKLTDEKKRFTTYYHSSTSTKTNMEILPDEWKKTTVTPMTKEIGEALKRGEKIEGAWLEENQSLVIK